MAAEFKQHNISVNALWPRTAIATAAVQNHLGGDESIRRSRKDTIMGDSAYLIMASKPIEITGQFIIVDSIGRRNPQSQRSVKLQALSK